MKNPEFNKILAEALAEFNKSTNADRIRAMTDEELAEWIIKHDCHTFLYGYDPKDAVLDWLKQEATDERKLQKGKIEDDL